MNYKKHFETVENLLDTLIKAESNLVIEYVPGSEQVDFHMYFRGMPAENRALINVQELKNVILEQK